MYLDYVTLRFWCINETIPAIPVKTLTTPTTTKDLDRLSTSWCGCADLLRVCLAPGLWPQILLALWIARWGLQELDLFVQCIPLVLDRTEVYGSLEARSAVLSCLAAGPHVWQAFVYWMFRCLSLVSSIEIFRAALAWPARVSLMWTWSWPLYLCVIK